MEKGNFELKVLSINLHCYQEEDQLTKFREVAKAIVDRKIQIIAFQEVGERKEWDGSDNAAKVINDFVREFSGNKFSFFFKYGHIGFDLYREGIAILSSIEVLNYNTIPLSYSIFPRNLIHLQLKINEGKFNFFNTHLAAFPYEGLNRLAQINDVINYCKSIENPENLFYIMACGLNAQPESEPYNKLSEFAYKDTFKLCENVPNPKTLTNSNSRIDYIFVKEGSQKIKTNKYEILFDGNMYRIVSDHYGVLTTFLI